MNLRSIERNTHTMHRIYANKTHDLISARKFYVLGFSIVYNGACDDLYQKIARNLKCSYFLAWHKHGTYIVHSGVHEAYAIL